MKLKLLTHCKFQSMKIIQNYHNSFEFNMTIVVILYDIHTLEFVVRAQTGSARRILYSTENSVASSFRTNRHFEKTVAIKFASAGSQDWWCQFIPF